MYQCGRYPGRRRWQLVLHDQHCANPGRAAGRPIAQGERFSAPIVERAWQADGFAGGSVTHHTVETREVA
jgi:hypothetical protein